MTTKQTKGGKAAEAMATKQADNMLIGIVKAVKALNDAQTATAALSDKINADCKALRDNKIVFGKSRRTCHFSQVTFDALIEQGYTEKTANNILSTIRSCVNDGKKFSFNPNRKAASNKGATKGKSIMIAMSKDDDGETAAGKLLNGFNKMKDSENDELANIAAFLIDALVDAGYAEIEGDEGDDE